jgi:hypothetical protein
LANGRLKPFLQSTLFAAVLLQVPEEARMTRVQAETTEGADAPELPGYPEMLASVTSTYGSELPGLMTIQLHDILSASSESESTSHESFPTDVRGFEAIGYRNESIRRYIEEGYPEGFFGRDAVRSVRYVTERISMPERYHITGYEAGHCASGEGDEPALIVLTPDAVNRWDRAQMFERVLTHELAHAADWIRADAIPPHIRLEILYRLTERLRSDTRLRFAYVEAIQGDSQEEEMASRVQEYLAELVPAVFNAYADNQEGVDMVFDEDLSAAIRLASRHDTTPEAAMEDLRIVQRLVRELDPEFSFTESARRRRDVWQEMETERATRLVEHEVERIEDVRLRHALMDVFHLDRDAIQPGYYLYDMTEEEIADDLFYAEGSNAEASDEDSYVPTHRISEETARILPYLVEEVTLARNKEVERLSARLGADALPAFEAWQQLIEQVSIARMRRFGRSVNVERAFSDQESADRAIETLNAFLRTLPSTEQREAFYDAVERFARIEGAGDIPLAAELREAAQRYMEELQLDV